MKTRFGKVLAAVALIIFAGVCGTDGAHFWNSSSTGGAHFWNGDMGDAPNARNTKNAGALLLYAESSVTMRQAGTLSTLLKNTDKELKISGPVNGTDVKYLRELVSAGKVTSLNLSDATIVSGGEAYYEKDGKLYTTTDNVFGDYMFLECAKLTHIDLPASVTAIGQRALKRTGLTEIEIPDAVQSLGYDSFSYINSLKTVVIGRGVKKIDQGAFYSTKVKDAYVKAPVPAKIAAYLFSSKPTIHVYTAALDEYQKSDWAKFGTLVGDLEEFYPDDIDPLLTTRAGLDQFFIDNACTTLKSEYARMNDKTLTKTMADAGMPQYMIDIALKVKNNNWAAYEKEFRIHSYKAYSDPGYWNSKLKATGGSYMGNPTGIYSKDESPIYVFVDQDIPDDATLYFAGTEERKIIFNSKTGQKLSKGLNIIDGKKDSIYYVLYTADTQSMTKPVSAWPEIKIHIEGGVVNGYFDVSRHTDRDYVALLTNATYPRFTVKGERTLFHFKTATFRLKYPTAIEKSIRWFDSLATRELELMGICDSVAYGQRAGYPYYLTGGEAYYPTYYNNPLFAVQGEPEDAGYAFSTNCYTSYNGENCVSQSFDVNRSDFDDWCAAHECGHNNQSAINLVNAGEVSNNLFSNVIRFTDGIKTSSGNSITQEMDDFANHVPYFKRDIWSMTRMYYQLYLYYHQAQKNTSFYPTLFMEFRADPMKHWQTGSTSSLKFVKKVCEVVQEDLTDFFTVWGFFEPCTIGESESKVYVVTQDEIDETLKEIAKYPKKNREILFIEDRVENVPTTDFLTTPGQIRRDPSKDGEFGDLGQFTDYLPGAMTRSSYTYVQSDSSIAMRGTGGVGFMVKDSRGKLLYASNSLNFTLPESVGDDFVIYSVDADGTLHKASKGGNATVTARVWTAGTLAQSLPDYAIKATITGPLNGTDIKYLRKLINEGSLISIDLSGANIVSGGDAYYEADGKRYTTSNNVFGDYMFLECEKLKSIVLPSSITSIGQRALKRTGLTQIEIPDTVQTLGYDSFTYMDTLETVVIGSGVTKLNQGVFYSSKVKDAYVYAKDPPKTSSYMFSSKPMIHVYARSLAAYQASEWAKYGTLVGDLK